MKDNLKLNLFIGAAILFIIAMLSLSSASGQGSAENFEPNPNVFSIPTKTFPVNMKEVKVLIDDEIITRLPSICNIKTEVVLNVLIDENGCYVRHLVLKVLKKGHPTFVEIVERNVNNLYFEPKLQANKPIPFWLVVPFKFKL